MAAITNSISNLKKGLRYGVIYVVTSLNSMNSVDMVSNQWLSSKLLDLLRSLTGFDIEVIELPEVQGTTLMARRINVGNSGKEAVVRMPLNYESISDVRRFVKNATDVLSTDEGDQVLEPDYGINMDLQSVNTDSPLQYSEKKSLRLPRIGWVSRKKKKAKIILEKYAEELPSVDDSNRYCEATPSVPTELEKEEKELLNIERQKDAALKAIQAQILDYVTTYHADPSELIQVLLEGKVIIGKKEQPSPLVVNNDLKIVLPNYNEVEVKMPAMCRTIYILFLKHPEGIALRDIADYRTDLKNIYSIVMPGRSEEKAQEAIENLLNPMNNTLNEYISKIKRCFKSCILNEELANKYCITGKRGESYSIALDPSLITLPRAVRDE
jgi:hypothetical protein